MQKETDHFIGLVDAELKQERRRFNRNLDYFISSQRWQKIKLHHLTFQGQMQPLSWMEMEDGQKRMHLNVTFGT